MEILIRLILLIALGGVFIGPVNKRVDKFSDKCIKAGKSNGYFARAMYCIAVIFIVLSWLIIFVEV